MDLINKNIKIENDELIFAGMSVKKLVSEFSSPLYIMDEDYIREKCRIYKKAIEDGFSGNGKILYASKALSFKYIYKIMEEENMGVDVVSIGEMYTAKSAGFDLQNAYFHSSNKTDEDIEYAIKNNIGYFVIDNFEELDVIDEIAKTNNIKQKVLIRITPGIDPHTYEKVATGKVDSKFGFSIETGLADEIVKKVLEKKNIILKGFHCHVGSQVFDSEVFIDSANVMIDFIKYVKDKYGYLAEELNLGGGYGVRYVESDKNIDIYENILVLSKYIKEKCESVNINIPTIIFEPGRSIVADSSITAYTVGNVKKIPGYKNYVSIDGGMGDNIRFALYGSRYTILPIEKFDRKFDMKCDIVGRYCESGDEIQKDVMLPSDMKRGDIIVCLTTGAYQYSMASNYNRVARPMIIMIKNKKAEVVVRREELEDLIKLDV